MHCTAHGIVAVVQGTGPIGTRAPAKTTSVCSRMQAKRHGLDHGSARECHCQAGWSLTELDRGPAGSETFQLRSNTVTVNHGFTGALSLPPIQMPDTVLACTPIVRQLDKNTTGG